MHSIILCGGSGTRLWPLSRKNFPKQFLSLYSDKSLLQETFLRINKLIPAENIILVTNKDNFFNAANQIKDVYPLFNKDNIVIEPVSLNTAPAIALGAKYLADCKKIGINEPIIILPSDHYIGSQADYLSLVGKAMAEIEDNIGTFGILPQSPNTGLGYIKKGEKIKSYFKAAEFKEKPDRQTAINYIESGEYLWNSGMYIFNIGTLVAELKKYAPEMHDLFVNDYGDFYSEFAKMPSISFDFAVSEKSDKVVVFEGDFSWDDIGSFDSLAEISQANGNHKTRHIGFDSKNIFVHSSSNRLIATLGVSDLIVIENNDSILIRKKGQSENVRNVVDYLKGGKMKELEHNLIVHRPWGKYEILIDEPKHKVKKITVYPDAKLSLQAHYHRAEHWVVIKGMAEVVNGEKTIHLNENESAFIPSFTKHRLANPGKINLELIEVQTGEYLEEDDIIRYEDVYNRIEQ